MTVDLYNIVSTQPEVKKIYESIAAHMEKSYPDEKLGRIMQFFRTLLDENRNALSPHSEASKASILFSATIPLIQKEIFDSLNFKTSCDPLRKKFAQMDIQPIIETIVADFIKNNYKALAECAMAPLFNKQPNELRIRKVLEVPALFKISEKANRQFFGEKKEVVCAVRKAMPYTLTISSKLPTSPL